MHEMFDERKTGEVQTTLVKTQKKKRYTKIQLKASLLHIRIFD